MATLKELSEYTGYSIATISRILNRDPTMIASEETKEKILSAASSLNYSATKSHKGRQRRPIMNTGIAEMLTQEEQRDDVYYLYLHNYIMEACNAARIQPVQLEHNQAGFIAPENQHIDGIIAIGLFTPQQQQSLCEMSDKIVYLNTIPDALYADSVTLDLKKGIHLALDYLQQRGHASIGFVEPKAQHDDDKNDTAAEYRAQYIKYMQKHGLQPCMLDMNMYANFIAQGSVLPTAFLTISQPVALHALQTLRQNKIRVPDDISIISLDDMPVSQHIAPPLTSVSAPLQQMCYTAVRLLLERMPYPALLPPRTVPVRTMLAPILIERTSTISIQK